MSPSDTTQPDISETIFARFQAGDEEAFAAIIGAYQRRIIGFIRLCKVTPEVAEELAQDAFVKLYQHRQKIESPEKLLPWLLVTSRRMGIHEAKKGNGRYQVELDESMASHLGAALIPGQLSNLETKSLGEKLMQAINTLKPVDHELIVLRFYVGLPLLDISRVLNMPMGSVGVKLRRALDRLGRELEKRGITPETVF